MQMNKNKGTLITIIVLLVIMIPLTTISMIFHFSGMNTKQEKNSSHNFYFENELYFYDKENNLIGKYACNNDQIHCRYATNTINDKDYALDYYKESEAFAIKLINNSYAFLVDDTKENPTPFLYDIKNERILKRYKSVKNYGIGIENDSFILEDEDGKYGVLSLSGEPKILVSFDYDFIGIANLINKEENKVMNDLFAVLKDNKWFLVNAQDAILTEPIDHEIVSYNGESIIIKKENEYQLINYQNENLLEEEDYIHLSFTGKYLNIVDNYNDYYVLDLSSKEKIVNNIHIKNTDKITSKINESNQLEIILNENVIQTIDLN